MRTVPLQVAGQKRRHSKRDTSTGRFVSLRTNGHNAIDAASTVQAPINSLKRRSTKATQFNWILPSVGAVTPVYLEMILRGALAGNHVQQYQLFDLMLDTWPELSSCIQELTYGVIRREIIFDPFTEEDEKPTPSAIERVKTVSSVLRRMKPKAEEDENGLEGTVTDLMDGWFRGVTVLEILWDTVDSAGGMATGPRATVWVQPQQYGFNQYGVLGWNTSQLTFNTSVSQYSAPAMQLEPFPDNKFLIGMHKVKSGSPLGGPMLRALAWWWCAANFSSDWLLNLAQVFGLPFRWASYPTAAAEPTVNAICDMLANMGSAGWAAFPEGTTLELKDAGKGGGESPQAHLLDRADRYARMLILGQTMTGQTMTSGKGGQAFGTVEAQLKEDRLEAASDYVADVFNQQLIPAILRLNYGNDDEAPVCRFLQENEGTYQDAQRDQILATIGLPIPLSHMRKKYSIPEPEGGEEVLTPPAPPAPPGGGQSKADKAAQGEPVGQQQKDRAQEKQKEVQARLEEISKISDDALFGEAIKQLASELVAGDLPGHEFHGNQYVTVGSTAAEMSGQTPHEEVAPLKSFKAYHVTRRENLASILKSGFDLGKVSPRWTNDLAVSLTKGKKSATDYFTKRGGTFDSSKYALLEVSGKGRLFQDPNKTPLASGMASSAHDYTRRMIASGYDGHDLGGMIYIHNPKSITRIREVSP